ncbi:xre family transcriptional regulator : : HTH_31 [Gemmata massiliana]|uniref:Xre family transcriptional regulator:: HTH_31 n=1 Tax=Gemmata massiliana TaxID=1210884 RepID=A0A6P2CZD4_9BACT|nr:helix-turn-helix transcriptional regulator [Gemmata massiliana]VTR92522.1 xre family transcriptional regulator : : HTH_31 [Gemmata massiliana]
MVTTLAKEKDQTGFGLRLKTLRDAKGLSQEALGELCNPKMRGQAIARLEGSGRTPSWETVIRLAKALNVPTDEFLPKD